MKKSQKCEILLLYSTEDIKLAEALFEHLKVFERAYGTQITHEGVFAPGVDTEKEYQAAMGRANIVMVLLSSDFIASDGCYSKMLQALTMHQQGNTIVFPVLLRDCAWKDTPIRTVSPKPSEEKAVDGDHWRSDDEPYHLLMEALRPMVQSIAGANPFPTETPVWKRPKVLGLAVVGLLALACLIYFGLMSNSKTKTNLLVMLDTRDGKEYPVVVLAGKQWMAKNLNHVMDGSVAFADDPSKTEQTGRLYSWEAAIRACPTGWHLPEKSEWVALIKEFGGTFDNNGMIGDSTAKHLNIGGKSGFNAQRGGKWDGNYSKFMYWGRYGYYWSSTPDNSALSYMFYFTETGEMIWATDYKEHKVSCRCVKD